MTNFFLPLLSQEKCWACAQCFASNYWRRTVKRPSNVLVPTFKGKILNDVFPPTLKSTNMLGMHKMLCFQLLEEEQWPLDVWRSTSRQKTLGFPTRLFLQILIHETLSDNVILFSFFHMFEGKHWYKKLLNFFLVCQQCKKTYHAT